MASEDVVAGLVRQLEFYFGEANLGKDRFLRQHLETTDDCSIPLQVVADFNRMKQLSADLDVVRQAVRQSNLIKLSADGERICLVGPLPDPHNVDDRTVYVERLPPKVDIDGLRTLFQPFGNVSYVSLPRFPDRTPKGFAFVEFSDVSEATAAVDGLVTCDTDAGKHTLKVLSKLDWLKLRLQYKELQRQAQLLLARQAHQHKPPHKHKHDDPKAADLQPATVVRVEHVNADTRKARLKEVFGKYGAVAYVDYAPGHTTGHVRFTSADEARKFLDTFQSEASIQDGDNHVTASLLTGEAETEYLAKAAQKRQDKKERGRGKKEAQPEPVEGSHSEGKAQEKKEETETKSAGKKKKRGKLHTRFDDDERGEEEAKTTNKRPADSEPQPSAKRTRR